MAKTRTDQYSKAQSIQQSWSSTFHSCELTAARTAARRPLWFVKCRNRLVSMAANSPQKHRRGRSAAHLALLAALLAAAVKIAGKTTRFAPSLYPGCMLPRWAAQRFRQRACCDSAL